MSREMDEKTFSAAAEGLVAVPAKAAASTEARLVPSATSRFGRNNGLQCPVAPNRAETNIKGKS